MFLPRNLSRREFLRAAALGLAAPPVLGAASARNEFTFVFLGDLHFDKLEHHDRAWVEKNHSGDWRQIENYSRITADNLPALFHSVRESVAVLARNPAAAPAFVLQAGDVVEGLCGTEELAARQMEEALASVREAELGAPFLFIKGNHDITGDGAPAAFNAVLKPFLTEQRHRLDTTAPALETACYTVRHQNALFCMYDAYDAESLPWLEATLAERAEQHCFVAIHPPVVPYGARANWILFNGEKQKAQREKLLGLLAHHEAYVLGGHIHRFNTMVRQHAQGRFLQFAISSVINAPEQQAKDVLSGVEDYAPDQIRVEPRFSPETAAERRALLEAERPFVSAFEYADLPGHAVIRVNGPQVTAEVYAGTGRQLWRREVLSNTLRA